MGLWTAMAWLAMGATVPLGGSVVDADGRPVEGASVWLVDAYYRPGKTTDILAETRTDAEGRFRVERDDALVGRGGSWSPTLWAYKPGRRVASREFKQALPGADEPVRLVLEGPTRTVVRVLLPDGKPALGARVRPTSLRPPTTRPPAELLDQITATTDAEGRATLDGFKGEDLDRIDVTAEGLVPQNHAFPGPDEPKVVNIRPVGRVAVRIVADDPKALKGWTVTATSTPNEPGYQGPGTNWTRSVTNDFGLVELRSIAVGSIWLKVDPPADLPYRATGPFGVANRAGERVEVRMAIQKTARVEGSVIEQPGGAPVPGVKVDLTNLTSRSGSATDNPVTDADGRFASRQLPGTVRFHILPWDMPKSHYRPPIGQDWFDFEVKGGEGVHTLAPIELRKAAQVRGRVLDQDGRPAVSVQVQGSWSLLEYGQNRQNATAQTDGRGDFVLGSIAPKAEVRVSANLGALGRSQTERVVAGDGRDLTLRIVRVPTLALAGRVLGPDGRPQSGALVTIRVRNGDQNGFNNGSNFTFAATPEIRTAADGTFKTPAELPVGQQYRAVARAAGADETESAWVGDQARALPDITLRRSVLARTVAGRLLDLAGLPVADAEVFQSGDGPKPTRDRTDAEGRFRVPGIPSTPAFLFARKDGYRLAGRKVDPGETDVEIRLPRLDEPPATRLKAAPSPFTRAEERAIARDLLAPLVKRAKEYGGFPESQDIHQLMARVDPDRIEAMIENQVIAASPALVETLRQARAEDDPRVLINAIEAGEPAPAASALIELFDRPGPAPIELRRELLDRALARARQVTDANLKAQDLALIADRWFDLDEPAKATPIAREAQALATDLPKEPGDFRQPTPNLAYALARVDLPAALKAVEAEKQPYPRDFTYGQIARRVAGINPAEARRLIALIGNEWSQGAARHSASLAMAADHPAEARALALEGKSKDEVLAAALPAVAARKLAASDPVAARGLLLEAMTGLARLAEAAGVAQQSNQGPSPAVVMARLLPLAARVDPDRAPGYLWLTLASRPKRPIELERRPVMPWDRQAYVNLAEIAMRIAPYDPAAAEAVLAPVLARVPLIDDETWGLGSEGTPIFKAVAAVDPRAALALYNALPDDPVPPPGQNQYNTNGMKYQHKAKLKARLAIATILGLPRDRRAAEVARPSQGYSNQAIDGINED